MNWRHGDFRNFWPNELVPPLFLTLWKSPEKAFFIMSYVLVGFRRELLHFNQFFVWFRGVLVVRPRTADCNFFWSILKQKPQIFGYRLQPLIATEIKYKLNKAVLRESSNSANSEISSYTLSYNRYVCLCLFPLLITQKALWTSNRHPSS